MLVMPSGQVSLEATMGKLQAVALVFVLLTAACHRDKPPNSYQVGESLLYQGKAREAVESLMRVPWSAPEAMAARRLVAETCTRIDLLAEGVGQPRSPVDLVEVVSALPHDPSCFTEGLEFEGDTLLESCGGYEKSHVRRVNVPTGAVLREQKLDKRYFGEGLTRLGGSIFVLTWLEGTGLVFDSELSQQERTIMVQGEGWGMTHDASDLIYSNGTNEIRFLDPQTGGLKR